MLSSPFPVYCYRPFLLEEHSRTLGHSKSTPRAVGHSWQLNSQALKHSGTWRSLEHSNTKGTWALGHWSTWDTRALEGHLGTQALGHLGTWKTRSTLFSRLFLYKNNCTLTFIVRLLLASSKSLQKKWSFSLMISSVDVTKSLMKNFIFVQWISTLTGIYNFVGMEIRRRHAS